MFVVAEAALMFYKTTSNLVDNHRSMTVTSTVSTAGIGFILFIMLVMFVVPRTEYL